VATQEFAAEAAAAAQEVVLVGPVVTTGQLVDTQPFAAVAGSRVQVATGTAAETIIGALHVVRVQLLPDVALCAAQEDTSVGPVVAVA